MKNFALTVNRTGLRYRGFMFLYILASAVISVGLVIMNRLSGQMSEAALYGEVSTLINLLIFITGVMLLRALASALSTFYLMRFSANAGKNLREFFVLHFLRVPFAVVEKMQSGERLSIYSNDIPRAQRLVSEGVLGLAADFISFISAFVFMMFISPRFTGFLFLAAIGMIVVQFLLAMPLQKFNVKMSEKSAKFNAVVIDSLQNLSVITAFSLEEFMEKRYTTEYNKFFSYVKKAAVAIAVMAGTMITLMFSPLIVILIVLALAVISGDMGIADFVAFVATVMVAAGGIMTLAQNAGRLAQTSAGAKRFNENTADEAEDAQAGAAEQLNTPAKPLTAAPEISFKNVSFSYSAEEENANLALGETNLSIKPGEKIAIMGESGSGKSTILKLLLGLYTAGSGEIKIGDKCINDFAKAELRDLFAYVPQNSFLFPESLSKNITLEDKITDQVRLDKACADAGIMDLINERGYDAVLQESAENLSGGQRQRIALARAFYKNAPVILFDEATSSLDPATEDAVLTTLEKAATGKTVIMVAHREKAVSVCDRVFKLEKPEVASA